MPLLAVQGASAGPVSASVSEMRVLESEIPADGAISATVVVWLRDAAGNTVRGKTVELEANPGSSAVITPPSGVSNEANGAVVFEVTDGTIEDVTLTATDTTDGIELTQTVTTRFVAPAAASGGIQALPATVAADGVSTTTITVTLLDGNGAGAVEKVVTLGHRRRPLESLVAVAGDHQPERPGHLHRDQPLHGGRDVHRDRRHRRAAGPRLGGGQLHQRVAAALSPRRTGRRRRLRRLELRDQLAVRVLGGCAGAAGLAFDRDGILYVVDEADGHLYRFGPAGGVANASTRVTTSPYAIGTCVQGLAFSEDGKQLYMARQGCVPGGNVVEISPTDGHIIRTVAPNIPCATGLATDPLSGDLFVFYRARRAAGPTRSTASRTPRARRRRSCPTQRQVTPRA